jgi:hypothetical protein
MRHSQARAHQEEALDVGASAAEGLAHDPNFEAHGVRIIRGEPRMGHYARAASAAPDERHRLLRAQQRRGRGAAPLEAFELLPTRHDVIGWLRERPRCPHEADVAEPQHFDQRVVQSGERRQKLRRERCGEFVPRRLDVVSQRAHLLGWRGGGAHFRS